MINNIRISPNELYGGQKIKSDKQINENQTKSFSELMNSAPEKKEEITKTDSNTIFSFGPPAGFIADVSMLDEADRKDIGLIQL